ncbi:winged helix-turn-helix domain-containing protein [Parabacteroides sp. OttesenSCG-928-G07]|nr:winged helix-turn-helix domain-containing protein [Parabacteroides sp. OttesenSCG-928-G21]MDL2278595.1 winged helix-turn-helix domain-containing protein [Parabacteroides sp. OttesenSCG-928-G07]
MTENNVGESAGKIWHLLAERDSLSIRKIGEMTSYKESHIFLALGWLARENKIEFEDKHNMLYVALKN